jgi:hypothetical protein
MLYYQQQGPIATPAAPYYPPSAPYYQPPPPTAPHYHHGGGGGGGGHGLDSVGKKVEKEVGDMSAEFFSFFLFFFSDGEVWLWLQGCKYGGQCSDGPRRATESGDSGVLTSNANRCSGFFFFTFFNFFFAFFLEEFSETTNE